MEMQRCLLTCKDTVRNSLICCMYWHPLSLLNGDTCVSKFLTPFFGMSCKKQPLHILFLSYISLYLNEMSNTVYCMSYVSSSPKDNHYAKSVTYSFFEVSSCTYTLHIKAVMGPEYMVIRIGLLTLRNWFIRIMV